MNTFATKHPLLTYFLVANVISWLIWLPLLIAVQSTGNTNSSLWWLHYIGGFGPLLSAFVVTALIGQGAACRNLLKRMAGIGAHKKWALIGLGLPLIFFGIAVIMSGITTGSWTDIRLLGQSEKLPGFGFAAIIATEIIVFGFGEEVGWRGFALPRLQAKYNALASTALLTLPWAFWHLPSFFYNENMMNMSTAGIFGWLLSLFTGALILTWLFNSSRGSILAVALFHGMIDVVFISSAVVGKLDNYIGALITVFAILLVIIFKPRRLAKNYYTI